jgi:hypothetical protein
LDEIAALVPGRTRWHDAVDPSLDLASGRTDAWTALEVSKLKDALNAWWQEMGRNFHNRPGSHEKIVFR